MKIRQSILPVLCLSGIAVVCSGTAQATDYYISCTTSGTPSGEGTQTSPWTSLTQANAVTLNPGDNLLFQRGKTCSGQLHPSGHGDDNAAVTIGVWGDESLPQPVIDGNGSHDAVLLTNFPYVTLEGLEIVNASQPGSERNGIQVNLSDIGEARNITLRNLTIHNVRGGDTKSLTGSAGILISVSGDQYPSWYDNLQILNNTIYDVDREGIYFKSLWNKRSEIGTQDTSGVGPWTPSTAVLIKDNTLKSIAGDGVKIDTTEGAVISHNLLAGFQLRSKENNAGIWTFNTNNTRVEYNDVSGGGNSHDGMSFDADGGSINTVFQYNYSHNNAGGLLLICPYSGAVTNGTVMRYNLSYNDKARLFQMCAGSINDAQIYNNSIWHDGADSVIFFQNDGATNVTISWRNNIIQNSGPEMSIAQGENQTLSFYNNDFLGVAPLPPNPDGTVHPGGMSSDPLFVGVNESDVNGFKLRMDSPVIVQGIVIPDNGGQDYYGDPVSQDSAPNMGAYEGKGL